MKAGFAAMVWAARIVRSVTRLRGDLLVQSVIEEEAGGNGTLSAVLRGYRADGAVVGEPTSMDLVPAHEGAVWFRLTVAGVSARAAYRTRGVSAIEKAIGLFTALRDHEAQRNAGVESELFQHVDIPYPLSIGTFHAGNWPATVPDSAVLEGRIAVKLGESQEEAKAALELCVQESAERDPFLRRHPPRLEFIGARFDSCQLPLNHPLAQAAGYALRTVNPGFRIWAKTPATDMRHLMLHGKTPTLIVGPGDDHLAHTANESVAVANVVVAAKFYALLALEWCG